MGYKIASFNMKNFGNTAGNTRDLNKIAEIIIGESFDIVALQEILSEGKGIKRLLELALGPRWGIAVSTGISKTSDNRDEQCAYIWNKQRVRLAETTVNTQYGEKVRVFEPHAINANGREVFVDESQFVRTPFYARFEPVNGGFFEFRLVNVHLYFGDNTFSEIERRQAEYRVLTQEVFPKISTNRRYGNNKQALTIIMGDYNLNIYKFRGDAEQRIVKQTYITTVYEYRDRGIYQRIETVQDELTTLKSSEDISQNKNDEQRGYSQNYDHFTIDTYDLQSKGISYNCKRIDAVREYCEDDFEKYKKTISDHVPIVIDIEF